MSHIIRTDSDATQVRVGVDFAKVAELEAQLAAAKAELAVTVALLAERNHVLRAIPECPEHGDQCVPNAMEWIRDVQRTTAALRAELARVRDDEARACANLCRGISADRFAEQLMCENTENIDPCETALAEGSKDGASDCTGAIELRIQGRK